jgi:hypothetical protein
MSKQSNKDRIKMFKVIAVMTGLAIVSVIGAIYIAVITHQPKSIITSREGEAKYFTDADLKRIDESARRFLKVYDLSDSEIANAEIVVRDGSVRVRENEYSGDKTISFLIDISNPRLTYAGSIVTGTEELFLTCPEISLMQDPSVFCVGNERESTIDVALGAYLPFDTGEASNPYISLWQDYDKKTDLPYLRANVSVCEDGEGSDEVREFINNWIREHGRIDPSVIPLKIHYLDC